MSKKIEKLKEVNTRLNIMIRVLETHMFIENYDSTNESIVNEKQISNKLKQTHN